MTDKEKLEYLVEKLNIVCAAIDNEMPDEALLELRRTVQTVEQWNGNVES